MQFEIAAGSVPWAEGPFKMCEEVNNSLNHLIARFSESNKQFPTV